MPKNLTYPKNRRLKKSEVKVFIESGGAKLHQEFTEQTYEKYHSGEDKQDFVYELPNGDFMYVFGKSWDSLAGKANYWERDSFLRHIRWSKKVDEDYKNGRGNSVSHWKYYSKQGSELFKNASTNLDKISAELNLDKATLDYSYESLGLIDLTVEKYGVEKATETLYDALVFYVGQVILNRVDGEWTVDTRVPGIEHPYITFRNSSLHYMPINIVWGQLSGSAPCNMRKATADEVRTNAFLHPKNN